MRVDGTGAEPSARKKSHAAQDQAKAGSEEIDAGPCVLDHPADVKNKPEPNKERCSWTPPKLYRDDFELLRTITSLRCHRLSREGEINERQGGRNAPGHEKREKSLY